MTKTYFFHLVCLVIVFPFPMMSSVSVYDLSIIFCVNCVIQFLA